MEQQSPEYENLQKDFLELCAIAENILNPDKIRGARIELQCLQKASECKEEDFNCLSRQIDGFLNVLKNEVRK